MAALRASSPSRRPGQALARSSRRPQRHTLGPAHQSIPWCDMLERYPPYQTCHRRFQRWAEEGVLDEILHALAFGLKEWGGLDLSECFVDGTFVGEEGGGSAGKTKRGKGTKLTALADRTGLPLAVHVASTSPHEVTFVEASLAPSFLGEESECLIGARAYDSDPLYAALRERGIEMIAPYRRNRKKPKTQDGRKLRRYKRRWKI